MEKRNIQTLKTQFKSNEQGYILVKSMVLVYSLKKIDVEVPKLNFEKEVQVFLNDLSNIIKNNLSLIEKKIGIYFKEIVEECINSYHINEIIDTRINDSLNIIINSSTDDIKEFIINEANFIGEKDDYSTPKNLIDLIIGLLSKNENQIWFDLGCGNGDFLVELTKKSNKIKCHGEDIDFNCYLLTKIRLYFTGIESDINQRNILLSNYNEVTDVAYGNTPFLYRLSQNDNKYNDLNKYVGCVKSYQNASWIFADRLLQAIKDRGIMIMTEASLMNYVDIDQRKKIIDNNLIEGIIKLPINLFSYTGISTSIVIFNKHKIDDKIKFIDATKMYIPGRRLNELNVDEILNEYNSSNKGTIISINEIIKNDYCLNTKKYVDVNEIVLENETILETVIDDVFRGVQIPVTKIDEYSKDIDDKNTYKLLGLGDIQNGSFEIDTLQVIKNDGKLDRYLVKNGDVIISAKSTKIKTAVVEICEEEKIVATGNLIVVRCNRNKINPVYLKTFLDSCNGSKLLESIQTGTNIISINVSALLNMKISLIDKEKQDKIAERFILKLDQFKLTKLKLEKLEKELNNVFDDSIGGYYNE